MTARRFTILVDVGEGEEEDSLVVIPEMEVERCADALRKPAKDCSGEEILVAAATLKVIELPDNWRIKEEA